jgi:hypothetical protein
MNAGRGLRAAVLVRGGARNCRQKHLRHFFVRAICAATTVVSLFCSSANADTKQDIQAAATAYHQGRIIDAAQTLQSSMKSATDPVERWEIANTLMDICTYSYEYGCIAANLKTLMDAAERLGKPDQTNRKVLYAVFLKAFLEDDIDSIRATAGLDFSLRIADTAVDPTLATRFYILNAAVQQHIGDFVEAHKYIDRAFSSLLRINTDTNLFDVASLIKELINIVLSNHDVARADRWMVITNQLVSGALPQTGFEFADFELAKADELITLHPQYKSSIKRLTR